MMKQFKLTRLNGAIMGPIAEHDWEAQAVFNPGTVQEGDTVHMLYRAVQGKNFSTLGYAQLDRQGRIIRRSDSPVIKQELDIEKQGCEDPRVVKLNETKYIFYTGFDGYCAPKSINTRIMLAETDDFIRYKKHGKIGPDVQDKDAMIFPALIDGKVIFIHRIHPDIQLASFESMEQLIHADADFWNHYMDCLEDHTLMRPQFDWETTKIGAGPPPILTEAGWLLIYHGVDKNMVYRTGAALLDAKNPYKLIARLPYPILEPEKSYEQKGDVDMVVFPEGTVQFGDELQIYYGAADKVIGLAVAHLPTLLAELWKHKVR